jgi:hypothetical protein
MIGQASLAQQQRLQLAMTPFTALLAIAPASLPVAARTRDPMPANQTTNNPSIDQDAQEQLHRHRLTTIVI